MKAKITFKKIFGVIIGTILLGLGIALFKLASLGQDPISALCFSINYLINENLSYSIFYFGVNFIFFILMILFCRENIHIGTIINLVFAGTAASLFLKLFTILSFNPENIFIRIIIGIIGNIIIAIGIAFYGGAKLGISPYDSLPLMVNKKLPKLKYKYIRIVIDLICLLLAFIIGVLILKRKDIINAMTFVSFVSCGPLISLFSKIFNKYFYKDESETFN